jgi:hypothetical protein
VVSGVSGSRKDDTTLAMADHGQKETEKITVFVCHVCIFHNLSVDRIAMQDNSLTQHKFNPCLPMAVAPVDAAACCWQLFGCDFAYSRVGKVEKNGKQQTTWWTIRKKQLCVAKRVYGGIWQFLAPVEFHIQSSLVRSRYDIPAAQSSPTVVPY